MQKNKGGKRGGSSTRQTDSSKHRNRDAEGQDVDTQNQRVDLRKIAKQIELLGSSHMTWKEKKDLENRKVVSLGGKPPKKQRLPLSVAKVVMKNQKEREQKLLQQNLVLGHFGGNSGGGSKRFAAKHRPEDRVLKTSEGRFKNGILDVKHLLRPTSSRDRDSGGPMFRGKKKGNDKNKGKKIDMGP